MRRARRSDAAAINKIYNQVIEMDEAELDIDPKTLRYREGWLAAHDRRHPVYVGEVSGKVVCWVALSPYSDQYAYDGVAVLNLYIEQSFRHQGLGGLLLKFAEQQATALGYYKIVLSVYATNLKALHAYRRAGYRDVGIFRNHGYHKGKLYDIVYMERLLPVDMAAINHYYRENYSFYKEFFQQEEQLLEKQMLRNGMVRSKEDPNLWIPKQETGEYLDDWGGETVRVIRNPLAPPATDTSAWDGEEEENDKNLSPEERQASFSLEKSDSEGKADLESISH